MPWTPYADLDERIEELLADWRRILGDGLVGAWIQGSFALGAGDLYSDCDWMVATHAPLTEEQVAALRGIHDEIATREGHWPHDIEGSYAPVDELASIEQLGRRWLFNDHGHRTLEWSDHCNRGYTRWILRHGITLTGPEPRTFMPQVPPELLRRETATAIPKLRTDLATWLDIDAIAWGQRYAVVTACRLLYTGHRVMPARRAGSGHCGTWFTVGPVVRGLRRCLGRSSAGLSVFELPLLALVGARRRTTRPAAAERFC